MTATPAQAALDPPLCDRSVELQAAILELTPDTKDHCGNFPESALREATTLNARNKGIVSLKRGDFHNFDSLTDLDLAYNGLRHLPGNVFKGLGEMNGRLNLEGNQLSVVSRDAFNLLRKLKELNLWSNGLRTLQGGMFRYLGELTYLNLGNNQISSFPTDTFESLGKLKELHLHNNRLETLPHRLWLMPLGLPQGLLQVLNLSGNRLRELQGNAFEEVKFHIRQLRLNDNQLTWLPADIFDSMNLNPTRGDLTINNRTWITAAEFVGGALRLDDNPGDGRPFGNNPDKRDGKENKTTTNEHVFTLPYYMSTEFLRYHPDGEDPRDDWHYKGVTVWTPHAAPLDLGIHWWKGTLRRDETSGSGWVIRTAKSGFEAKVNQIKAGANFDSNPGTGGDIHWDWEKELDIDFELNPPNISGNTGCGFSPCYDGFGFHTEDVWHKAHRDESHNKACITDPRLNYVNDEWNCHPSGNIHPTFTPSPDDPEKGYRAGEVVEVQVPFNTGPLVKFDPGIVVRLRIGANERNAGWAPTNVIGRPRVTVVRRRSGHEDEEHVFEALRFRYRITQEDADDNGIEIRSISGSGRIESVYRSAGAFRHGRNYNRPNDAAHKVYGGPYVSFVSSDAVFAKEGETVDLDFQISPAAESDLVVDFTAYAIGGTDWAEWQDYEITNSVGGDRVGVAAGETSGSIRIRIRDEPAHGHDNREPEPAREAVSFCLDRSGPGAGYERAGGCKPLIIKEGVCDRTPEVQTALMAVTGRRDCGDVTVEDLAIIGELDMRDHEIRSLKRSDFLGLNHVSVLDLRNNRLSMLPEGVFDEISDTLKVLRLQGNRWQRDPPAGTFTNLPNVQAIFVNDDPNADAAIQLPLRIDFAGEKPDFPLAAGTRVGLRLLLDEGAPFDFTVKLASPDNGNLEVGGTPYENVEATAPFARGETKSDFTFVASEEASRIEIIVGQIERTSDGCLPGDSLGRCFSGIDIVTSEKAILGGVRVKVRVFLENALE